MGKLIPLALQPIDEALLYRGAYDPVLVSLSVAVAIVAAYAALLVASHVAGSSRAAARHLWTVIGGLCLGAGIWAMHFVGMLAFNLPCSTTYDPALTLLSMVPGILASILAMAAISRVVISPGGIVGAGLLLGAGIGTMHFSGMAALRLAGVVLYDPTLFALSIGVAVALSIAALAIRSALMSARSQGWRNWSTTVSAVVMGLAVSGMHYTAMASTRFVRLDDAATVVALVTPTFLATVVLAVTSAIIVLTLVGNFLANPAVAPLASHYRIVAVILVGWTGTAWLVTDYYGSGIEERLTGEGLASATEHASMVAANIEYEIGVMRGIASLVAKDQDMLALLRRPAGEVAADPAARQRAWKADERLAAGGRALADVSTSLGADVVYLLDAAGNCIATSNGDTPASFLGASYADRDYFRYAKGGRPGFQYAFGRTSKVAGLYASHPVIEDGRVQGVVVVKRDVLGFVRWTRHGGSFISDPNGVVILAEDDRLSGRAMPDSTALHLSEWLLEPQYGQKAFAPVDMTPWRDGAYPGVVRLRGGNEPLALASAPTLDGLLTIHTIELLPQLDKVATERRLLFLLLAVAGDMTIIGTASVLMYLRSTRQAKERFEGQARELQRSNADLERFTLVLAHHIQEPVRLQRIFAQRLARSLPQHLSEASHGSLDHVLANAERLHNLIADVQRYLALGQSEQAAAKPCDAGTAFAAARARQAKELAAVGAEVEVAPLPMVAMSERTLAEVFHMLLENAITYRHPERPLRIRVGVEDGDHRPVLFVSDNGSGIAAEFRERVFEVFERLHSGRHPGTGIGLALVKKAVEAAGGRVWITDGEDGGTRFCLALSPA